MNIEDFRDYCLLKAGVTEETPFGPETLVFKVGGKIFAMTDIDTFGSVNLKCDPERAQELREAHDYVLPGYHSNKRHWNTVLIGTGAPDVQLRELIGHSYELVRAGLPKAVQATLEILPRSGGRFVEIEPTKCSNSRVATTDSSNESVAATRLLCD